MRDEIKKCTTRNCEGQPSPVLPGTQPESFDRKIESLLSNLNKVETIVDQAAAQVGKETALLTKQIRADSHSYREASSGLVGLMIELSGGEAAASRALFDQRVVIDSSKNHGKLLSLYAERLKQSQANIKALAEAHNIHEDPEIKRWCASQISLECRKSRIPDYLNEASPFRSGSYRKSIEAASEGMEQVERTASNIELGIKVTAGTVVAIGVTAATAGVATGTLTTGIAGFSGGTAGSGFVAGTTLGTTAIGAGNIAENTGHLILGNKTAGEAAIDTIKETAVGGVRSSVNAAATLTGLKLAIPAANYFLEPAAQAIVRGAVFSGTSGFVNGVYGAAEARIGAEVKFAREVAPSLDRSDAITADAAKERFMKLNRVSATQLGSGLLIDTGTAIVLGGGSAGLAGFRGSMPTGQELISFSVLDIVSSGLFGIGGAKGKAIIDSRELTAGDIIPQIGQALVGSVGGNIVSHLQPPKAANVTTQQKNPAILPPRSPKEGQKVVVDHAPKPEEPTSVSPRDPSEEQTTTSVRKAVAPAGEPDQASVPPVVIKSGNSIPEAAATAIKAAGEVAANIGQPQMPKIVDPHHVSDAVDRTFAWKGAGELYPSEAELTLNKVTLFAIENSDRFFGKQPIEIAEIFRQRFGAELPEAAITRLGNNIFNSIQPNPVLSSAAQLLPGDVLVQDINRVLILEAGRSSSKVAYRTPEGEVLVTEMPHNMLNKMIQTADQVERGPNAALLPGRPQAVPATQFADLRAGDVIHAPNGRRIEIVEIGPAKTRLLLTDPEGNAGYYETPGIPAQPIAGMVERRNFSNRLTIAPSAKGSAGRIEQTQSRVFQVSEAASDVEAALGDLQTALAQTLSPATDRMAEVWGPVYERYYGASPQGRLDRRFSHILMVTSEVHDAAGRLTASIRELDSLVAPVMTAEERGQMIRSTKQVPVPPDGSVSQGDALILQQRATMSRIGQVTMMLAGIGKSRLPKNDRVRELYSEISDRMNEIEGRVADARDAGARSLDAIDLLAADLNIPSRGASTAHEAKPSSETIQRLSDIAMKFRYQDDESGSSVPVRQQLFAHPERFDRGITVASPTPAKFKGAFDAGAELITAGKDGKIEGFAVYFPPDKLTSELKASFGITGESRTAYLLYTGIDPDVKDPVMHDQLMNSMLLNLRRTGADKLDLQIFRDNFPSAVAHIKHGVRINGVVHSGPEGDFLGFSLPADPDGYLLRGPVANPTTAIRQFIISIPEYQSLQDARMFWNDNTTRLAYLATPGAPKRALEADFRGRINQAMPQAVNSIFGRAGDTTSAWQQFLSGNLNVADARQLQALRQRLVEATSDLVEER